MKKISVWGNEFFFNIKAGGAYNYHCAIICRPLFIPLSNSHTFLPPVTINMPVQFNLSETALIQDLMVAQMPTHFFPSCIYIKIFSYFSTLTSTGTYSEPVESSSSLHIFLSWLHFNIISKSTPVTQIQDFFFLQFGVVLNFHNLNLKKYFQAHIWFWNFKNRAKFPKEIPNSVAR